MSEYPNHLYPTSIGVSNHSFINTFSITYFYLAVSGFQGDKEILN